MSCPSMQEKKNVKKHQATINYPAPVLGKSKIPKKKGIAEEEKGFQ